MQNDLKRRLATGTVCIGGWVQAPSPAIVEAMATCGFDWVAVDMEHATHSVDQAALCFLAAERHGVTPLVRLPCADPYLARRLLDSGAQGIIVPCVEHAQAFFEFASHCRYPPQGRRGVGLSRVSGWGDRFDPYFREFEPVLVPQIETVAGVRAAAQILALPCVDAVFVGPYDLSASLGKPGDFATSEFAAAITIIKTAALAKDTPIGIHQVTPDISELRARIEEGYRFLAFGTDLIGVKWAFQGLRDIPR